jgi:hypothetical protein
MKNRWLTPREVAAKLQVHPGTLANWRCYGRGPKFTKLTDTPRSPVRYRESDVDAYMQQMERGAVA